MNDAVNTGAPAAVRDVLPRGRQGRRPWLLLLWLCTLAVAGCGFHLRGALVDASHLPAVYIDTTRGSNLAVEVSQTFHRAGVSLTDERDRAEWLLLLSDEEQDRRVLSVDSSGKVQEYELHYGVYYQVQDSNGQPLLDRQELSLLRDYSFSGTDVLAKDDEETLLYRGMRQQAAQIILRRLLSLKPGPTVTNTPVVPGQ
jgi:LPS-assembly lipoprotein